MKKIITSLAFFMFTTNTQAWHGGDTINCPYFFGETITVEAFYTDGKADCDVSVEKWRERRNFYKKRFDDFCKRNGNQTTAYCQELKSTYPNFK